MWNILKLDKNLANQISAWEVVERPLSVVKELVENSIDANAKNIKIEIENWWKKLISIIDDWDWIDKDDLEICLEKYSTSKIKSIQDLYNVMTFGFRWEALASISSVSKISIISKRRENDKAYELTFDSEHGQNLDITTFNTWTKVKIKDLFYNTPARLNYLKKDRTEYLKILDYIQKVSLSNPSIWFELISDWKQILNFKSWEDLKTRIYNIYWSDLIDILKEVSFEMPWIKITWFISSPKTNFANKNKQVLFVNSRPIVSPIIFKAIKDAYNRFIPHNLFPAYILNIDIDPTLVDVNVHPRKMEVRFANENNIFRSVYHSILDELEKESLVNNFQNTSHNIEKVFVDNKDNSWTKLNGFNNNNFSSYSNNSYKPSFSQKSDVDNSLKFTSQILWNNTSHNIDNNLNSSLSDNTFTQTKDLHYTNVWKIIWQIFDSYIVVENWQDCLVFDQHALAERIIYEKLVKNNLDNVQQLLFPENITLTVSEYEIFIENRDHIISMWFDIELLSNSTISIYSIPDFLKKQDLKEIFMWIIDDIASGNIDKAVSLDDVKNTIHSYTACRAAVKFWDKLSLLEMNKLLNEWTELYSSTCPHWRPSVYKMSKNDLNQKFLR